MSTIYPSVEPDLASISGTESLIVDIGSGVCKSLLTSSLFPRFSDRFINGSMDIDQRHNGANQVISASDFGDTLFRVDRWGLTTTAAPITAAQIPITAAGGWIPQLKNALLIAGSASSGLINLFQRVESINIFDLASSVVTLSGYIWSTNLTSVSWFAYYPSAIDNWGVGITQFASGSFSLNPNYIQEVSAQISLPSNVYNGIMIYLQFGPLGAGEYVAFSGLQLVPGSTVLPIDRRPLDIEQYRCQRYCPAYNALSGNLPQPIGWGNVETASLANVMIPFPAPPRIPPTGIAISNLSSLTLVDMYNRRAFNVNSLSLSNSTSGIIAMCGLTGGTINRSLSLQIGANGNPGSLYFTGCEL